MSPHSRTHTLELAVKVIVILCFFCYSYEATKQSVSGVPCLKPWVANETKPTTCSGSGPVRSIKGHRGPITSIQSWRRCTFTHTSHFDLRRPPSSEAGDRSAGRACASTMRRQPFPEQEAANQKEYDGSQCSNDVGPGSLLPPGSFEERTEHQSQHRVQLRCILPKWCQWQTSHMGVQ